MPIDNFTITLWAAIIMAVATCVIAWATIENSKATKKMIRENSRTVWKNNVIIAVSDYIGYLDSVANSKFFSELSNRANAEKAQSLRIKLTYLLNDDKIAFKLCKLWEKIIEISQCTMSEKVKSIQSYNDLRELVLRDIKYIIEDSTE